MTLTLGVCEMELGSKYLTTELADSSSIMEDTEALRLRMKEDGYLFFRGFHDKHRVEAARNNFLHKLHEMGKLDHSYPVEEGIVAEGAKSVVFGHTDYETELPDFFNVVNSAKVMSFFDRFLGGPSLTLDYKWPRAVAKGSGTHAHYDIVYMGRGTKQLYTMWTPIGDVPMELGALCICQGSHRFEKLLNTYGQVDVSKDKLKIGWFSDNPIEIVDQFGGQWLTTDFKAGDAIIFGMYTLHMSFNNQTERFRTSCDTRYQLASEPVDARFMGTNPVPPSSDGVERTVDIKQLREQWKL